MDDLVVSMFLSDATMNKYFTGNAIGINNEDFPGDAVPFAYQSDEEVIALKKFARAHKARRVEGPPTWLLTLRIPATYAVEHILKKEIKVVTDRPEKTVGFLKPVNAYNFPRMQPTLTHIDTVGVPESLLASGRKLFE